MGTTIQNQIEMIQLYSMLGRIGGVLATLTDSFVKDYRRF